MNKLNNIKFNNESFPKTIDILNSSPVYDAKTKKYKINLIKKLLKEKDAKIIAHYYTHEDIQEVAELTGGKPTMEYREILDSNDVSEGLYV